MLYGRTVRTKLPELYQLESTCIESHDQDKENKEKSKMNTDARKNDIVLMKQKKTGKLSTNFYPNPMKTVSKGNIVY